MGVVKVNNLIVYAYHGCLAEEAIIGGEYVINIKAWGKTKGSAKMCVTKKRWCIVQRRKLGR